jgi:hypothetical protein
MTAGTVLPPVTLFFDGSDYWLADGFHRYHAHNKIGALEIAADVRNGTKRDAVLFSVGANGTHGLQRTNADKRRAVETLLGDDEWSVWSDREIAKRCGVSNDFASRVRKSSLSSDDSEKSSERTYTTKHGTEAAMKTANIGKREQGAPKEGAPVEKKVSSVQSVIAKPADSEDDEDLGIDPIAELEVSYKENNALHEQVVALSSSDAGAELLKQVTRCQGLEARLAQQIDKSNQLDKELRYFGKMAKDLRDILGVESNSKIVGAVRAAFQKAA